MTTKIKAKTLGQIGYETMCSANAWRAPTGRPLSPWCPGAIGSDTPTAEPIPPALSETEAGRDLQRKWELVGEMIARSLKSGMV